MIAFITSVWFLVRCTSKAGAWLPPVAILAGALAFSPAAAWADNAGWYAGVDAGQSLFTDIRAYGSPIYPDSFRSTGTGYRLSAGYKINHYFGLEAAYVDLGKVTGSYTTLGGGFCGLICAQSYIVNGIVKTRGWTLELVGSYPFNDRWQIFVRAGDIQANSELNASYTPIPPYNVALFQNFSDTSSDTDVTYGLGVKWLFAGHWAARLSLDRYVSMGHELRIGSFNVALTSVGVVYQF